MHESTPSVLRPACWLALTLSLAACASSVAGHGSPQAAKTTTVATAFPSMASSTEPTVAPSQITSTVSGPTQDELVARFAGNWTGHGRALTVTGQTGSITYRVYKWCSEDPTPPCDKMQGNQIIDGGRITIHLGTAHVAGNVTVAEASITASTDPAYPTGTALTASVQNYLLTLSIFTSSPFCAPTAPSDACGA